MAATPKTRTDRVAVLLDPGMIFGTGAHASTQMCMRDAGACRVQGGEQVHRPRLRLRHPLHHGPPPRAPAHATGVDIDPKAEDIARENAAINQIFCRPLHRACTGDVIGDTAMMEKLERRGL